MGGAGAAVARAGATVRDGFGMTSDHPVRNCPTWQFGTHPAVPARVELPVEMPSTSRAVISPSDIIAPLPNSFSIAARAVLSSLFSLPSRVLLSLGSFSGIAISIKIMSRIRFNR